MEHRPVHGVAVDDHDGDTSFVPDARDLVVHLVLRPRVEPLHRLVEEEQPLRPAERTGQERLLPLTAGEIPEAAFRESCETHPLHRIGGERFLLPPDEDVTGVADDAAEHDLPDRRRAAQIALLRHAADVRAG